MYFGSKIMEDASYFIKQITVPRTEIWVFICTTYSIHIEAFSRIFVLSIPEFREYKRIDIKAKDIEKI